MWYLVKKELKGVQAWRLSWSIFISIIQVACNVILPLLLNYLTEVANGKSIVNLGDKYYQTITSPDMVSQTILTAEGQRIESTILMFIMLGVCLVALVAGGVGGALGSKVAIEATKNMRINMYNKVQSFAFADLDKFKTSSLITRLTTDIYSVQESLVFILRVGFRAFFLYIGGIIGVIILILTSNNIPESARHNSWVVPVVVIISSVITLLFISLIIWRSTKLYDKNMKQTDITNSVMRESILGVRVVKSFNLQEVQKKKFEVTNQNLTKIATRAATVSQIGFPIVTLIMNATIAAVLGFGGLTKTVSITEVITLIQLITIMMIGLILFVIVLGQIGSSYASANRIKEVTLHEPKIQYEADGADIKNGTIEFKNVSFKYNETGELVLKNINLKIKEKQTIGIIGGTGSGKTSLISLIARQYDISDGELLVSGNDIKKINEESLRKEVAISPQKVTIFSGTIASNLKYGKKDANEADMLHAAKIAEAYDFIQSKEAGFESRVEQRGRNFSGGQKQRLSIARTVIKDAKILILDDSTSALDMITEKNVQHNLKAQKADLTKIIVAQRISAVKHSDQIIVLDKGEIVGQGNHLELLEHNQIYREIAISQMGEEGVHNELRQQ